MTDANALLMGSSIPSATFPEAGTEHKGVILGFDSVQAKNFKTQKPEFWDDGNPKMQVRITLQTDERDPEAESDNGVRRLYVSSKGMREAIAAAVKKTGASGLAVGGKLAVQYTRDGQSENGLNPPKMYAAFYQPPPMSQPDHDEPGEYDDYGSEPF